MRRDRGEMMLIRPLQMTRIIKDNLIVFLFFSFLFFFFVIVVQLRVMAVYFNASVVRDTETDKERTLIEMLWHSAVTQVRK